MRKLIIIFFAAGILGSQVVAQQSFKLTVVQPPQLLVDAGMDTTVCPLYPVTLGGMPTAEGGTGAYFYTWTPQDNLDDPTSANPIVITDSTTTYMVTVTDERGCSVNQFITVNVDPCLGINDRSLSSTIHLYPNPANQSFYVSGWDSGKTTTGRVLIYNGLGQIEIDTRSVNLFSLERMELDVSILRNGIYYVKLLIDDEVVVRQIQIIK